MTYSKTKFEHVSLGGQIETASGGYGGNGTARPTRDPATSFKPCKLAQGRWSTCLDCQFVVCVYDKPDDRYKMRRA
jgi:hypothetical protein